MMENNMLDKTYRIETIYTLKAPLSHIGSSESTETFLNTITIRNGDKVNDVFAYTGNAIRGAWRDAGARYLLDRLGGLKVPKKTFHLLFSGGSISGAQSIDVGAAKQLRGLLPFLSIFGGGVGNQILSGKITQTFAYPVCKETDQIIPSGLDSIDYSAQSISWTKLTQEVSFSRKDDGKDILGDTYILQDDITLLDTDKKPKGEKDKSEPAAQMRYTSEYLIPNTQLYHRLDITCNEVELGALVASIHEWGKKPYLGGLIGKGFGLVDAEFIITAKDGERESFITITNDGLIEMSEQAEEAKDTYDKILKSLYTQYIEGNKDTLIKMLEG